MCKQRVALDMINGQARKGGLSKAALLLHEEQCKDFEQMDARMTKIEQKVENIEKKVDGLDEKLERVLALVGKRSSVFGTLKEVLSNKVFLYLLITLLTAAFGVSVGEVGTFLFK